MSNYEPKDNSGAMFVNDKKESEKHPDRKGSAIVDGIAYWVSGWINESAGGQKYMSLKFTKKEPMQKDEPMKPAGTVAQKPVDFDEDIPF